MVLAQEDFGGFGELAPFQAVADLLNFAELIEAFMELAGEARAVEPEFGQGGD